MFGDKKMLNMKTDLSIIRKNYNFTKKNVILGDIDNSVKIELVDFKLFTKKLTKNEVNRNFYYGVKSNCFESSQTSEISIQLILSVFVDFGLISSLYSLSGLKRDV